MPYSSDNWDWTEDDDDGDRAIPRASPTLRRETTLVPAPPKGWFKFFSYDSSPPVETPQLGAWIYCLWTVREWEAKHGRVGQAHMISRDAHGWRVLIVHPDLLPEANDVIESLNSILTDCNCGGYCIEPYFQGKAGRVLLRRACQAAGPEVDMVEILRNQGLDPAILRWAEMSIGERVGLAASCNFDPADALDARHWIDALPEDASSLASLAQEVWEASGARPVYELESAAESFSFPLLEAV